MPHKNALARRRAVLESVRRCRAYEAAVLANLPQAIEAERWREIAKRCKDAMDDKAAPPVRIDGRAVGAATARKRYLELRDAAIAAYVAFS